MSNRVTCARNRVTCTSIAAVVAVAALCSNVRPASAASRYPVMAAIEQYRMPRAQEIAMARSAAPPSISNDAQVLTLGAHGYDVAARGTNGFVCIVQRAWANDFDSDEFWNPKLRGPLCFNPPAARSVLPEYLRRTQWVLAGATQTQLLERTKAAVAAKQITVPEPGAMCYMLSKQGYLGDDAGGPWRPHLMFFLPPTPPAQWGANKAGSPIIAFPASVVPVATFLVPVATWSDGTPYTPRADSNQ